MLIRKFKETDATDVSNLMAKTLRITNKDDYSKEYIEDLINRLTPQNILDNSRDSSFYVIEEDGDIVACGAIGPYLDKEDETYLFSIFVDPKYQKRGLGKKIIEAIESDELFLKSSRIVVPASLTAVDFYLRLGYKYSNNERIIDNNGLIELEKFNNWFFKYFYLSSN